MDFIFLAVIFSIPHIVAHQYNKGVSHNFCKVTWEPWAISTGLAILVISILGVL